MSDRIQPLASEDGMPVSGLRLIRVIVLETLALSAERKLDGRRQRALTRYYVAAGAGGIAAGVHTTQFEIRLSQYDLLRPVLEPASHTADEALSRNPGPFAKIAGVIGKTPQA